MPTTIKWSDVNKALADSIEVYISDKPIPLNDLGVPVTTLPATATSYDWTPPAVNKVYNCRLRFIKGTDDYVTDNTPFSTYTTTGPGPQTIVRGDWNYGYMGNVSEADFIAAADLKTLTGIPAGTTVPNITGYNKFSWGGKIIFIPNGSLVGGVTWKQIYDAGLMYGVDGPGDKPSVLTYADVDQKKIITIGSNNFLCRTIKGSTFPVNQLLDPAQPDIFDSEYNELVASTLLPGTSPSGDLIRFSDTALHVRFAYITQNLFINTTSTTTRWMVRGSSSDPMVVLNVTTASNNYNWSPVLELQF